MRQMKLGTKIAMGYGGLLLIAVLLGCLAIYNMLNVKHGAKNLSDEYAPSVTIASQLERNVQTAMYNMQSFNLAFDEKGLAAALKNFDGIEQTLKEGSTLVSKSTNLGEMKTGMENAGKALKEYRALVNETAITVEEMKKNQTDMAATSKKHAENCTAFLKIQNDLFSKELDEKLEPEKIRERAQKIALMRDVLELGISARFSVTRAHALRKAQYIQDGIQQLDEMAKKLETLRTITVQAEHLKLIDEIKTLSADYGANMKNFLAHWQALENFTPKRVALADEILKQAEATAVQGAKDTATVTAAATTQLSTASNVMIGGLIVAIVLGITTSILITRSITRPLNRAIEALSAGSEQVASASCQISQSSQQLAEGSTEQASSLEESSSALEELAGQAHGNAEKAHNATEGADQARQAAEQAHTAMGETVSTMTQIKESSGKISGIIKTIEEIAFQTNLLALNAAVEAARAGEHGKGFAVVAEEVRNLAQRSAAAAKDTAGLIETSVEQSNRGAEVVDKASEAINKILQVTAAVAEQTREVTTASKEQSEGINQINSAIAQMDKVTQQVAANAEESASASEELSAQAQQMQGVVADLVNMVQASSTARERPNFELGYATTSPHPLPANRANSNMTLPYYSANEKRTLPRPENALHY